MPPPSNRVTPPPAVPGAGASLDQWLAYLESIHPTEIDLGLDRVLMVLRRLFRRKPAGRIITVAGTNGKGSTVAAVEALLMAHGRRTGAYTSPHIQRYNERVRIDGADVPDATLVAALERVEQARGNITLTYFEFGTLAAFVVFADAGVEDWILEVGLGGRLDAVNVLDADLAIITSVDIDHVAFLGDNREVIGFEKAGILRPGIPAVCADETPPNSVLQQASAQGVKLALSGRDYRVTERAEGQARGAELVLHYLGESFVLPSGPLPVASVAAAVVAVRTLVRELPADRMTQVLSSLRVPGRFEKLGEAPALYVDVGHNPHAAGWLAGRLQALKGGNGRVHAVYAALADKDVEGVLRAMSAVVDHWYLAGLAVPRGLAAEELLARAGSVPDVAPLVSGSVAEAIGAARKAASEEDTVIVFGSFYTVAEARALLTDPGLPA